MPDKQPEGAVKVGANAERKRDKTPSAENAKAKSARLRLMKERNENYLAEREIDEALAMELRIAE